ncbi:MAG: hypothetical protein QME42_08765 [bacterium]|nr:hypothetical protein [bacterium]
MKRLILGLMLIWNSIAVAGIALPSSVRIEDEADIFELVLEGIISWDDYYTLSYLYLHPLDLNKVKRAQLEELPNVTPDLAQQIYDKKPCGLKPLTKIEEIIPIIGQELFDQIKVFITVKPIWKGNLNLWLNETKGDHKKADLNTRLCLYTKEMELGGLGEREDNLELKKRYLLLNNPNRFIRKVIFGNHQARFGEGVVYNTAHRKTYRGIVSDDGTRKSDIQDGLIVETSIKKLTSTFFYSWVDLEEFPNNVFSKFDGKEELWGGHFNLDSIADIHIGATAYVSNFTSKDGKAEKVEILGIDFLKRFKEAEIAGEIAKSKNQGGLKPPNGLLIRGYKKFSNFKYWLALRRYEQNFINPHSQVEKGDEKGGSAQMQYNLNNLTFKLSGDYHQHPSTLITDEKYWTSLDYKLCPRAEITAKIEWEDKDISRSGDGKKVYSFALNTKPHFKLDINSFYRYTNDDGAITDYIYTKLNLHFKPGLTLTGRFKYGPEGDRETYGQVKMKIRDKELTAKYTHTHDELHPDGFYLRMKIGW